MHESIESLLEKKRQILRDEDERVSLKYGQTAKLSARKRLAALFDGGLYTELFPFIHNRDTSKRTIPGDGVVTANGYVNGCLVFAYAQDYTLLGGSLGEMQAMKITRLQDEALKLHAPIVALIESGGARIQEGVDALAGYGEIFHRNCKASGVIPQIAIVLGSCAGGAVYSPALMDFIFMEAENSRMFVTGPDVVKVVTGEQVTAEVLGGASTHNQISGVAHFFCSSENDCFIQVKKLLSFVSASVKEVKSKAKLFEFGKKESLLDRRFDEIVPENPKQSYDMHDIIRLLVDDQDYLEVQEGYARNCIIAFARIGGRSVGIVANQPQVLAGCIDINASDKMARFIRTCDSFGLPLVTLVDTPGYLPGVRQEQGGIIRHGAKLLYAYSEASNPKMTIIVRKAYGGAYIAMGSKSLGADRVLAWPFAEIAVLGADSAASIIYRKEIAQSSNPKVFLAQKAEEYKEVMNPFTSAAKGYVDDIIQPAETRTAVMTFLENYVAMVMPNGHGNIPL